MKYMGSKSRIVKDIVPIIQKYINDSGYKKYFEPFGGGMNVIVNIDADEKIASDYNKYLIALFKHLQSGGNLLDEVPRELYNDVRSTYKNSDCKYEDWFVGNVGFLASYNGRWFDGGYSKSGYEKTKNGERYRDYYQESKNNILEQANKIKDIKFVVSDYRLFNPSECVIYCDPPYQGTKQYDNAKNFDYDEFWNIIRKWSKDNIVIVSELNAPSDFKCIWEKNVSRTMKSTDNTMRADERMFIYNI